LAPGKKYVVDLFCGIGGWTEGAEQAGHTVALVVDSNRELLKCHLDNHPKSRHLLMELGAETEESLIAQIKEVVPHGQPLHVHGSPPCTKLSTMQGAARERGGRCYDMDTEEGMRLVTWFFSLIVRLRPDSWSFEQVPMPEICGALRVMKTFYPSLVDFCKRVNFKNYGLGQHRVRAIAGTPYMIDALKNDRSLRADPPSIAEALTPPEEATLVHSSAGTIVDPQRTIRHDDGTYTNDAMFHKCYRPLTNIAFTCLAGNPQRWSREDFTIIRRFTPRECATIQSFPPLFKLPTSNPLAYMGVGNAVPPLFAHKFMKN